MADIEAIAEAISQQLYLAGPQARQEGIVVWLPQYLDAAEIATLELTLSTRLRVRYEITHHLGERRIGVRKNPDGRIY
jgi:hypothetical protein